MVDAEKNPRVQVYLYFADEWREKGIGYLDFSIHKSLSPDIVSLDKNAGTSSDIVVEVNKEETSEKNINDNAKEKTLKINSSNISEDASKALLNSGIAGEDSPKLNEGGSIEEIFDHKIDDDDDEETDVLHNEKDSDENVVNNRVITNIEIKVFDQDNESLKLLDVSISDETDIKLQEETIISWYDGVYERALSFESPKDCITVFSTIVKARELKENEKSTESTSNQNSLFGLSEDDILSSSETYPEVSVESLDKWMDALKQDSKLQSNLGDISQSKDAVNISSFSTAANLYNYLNKNDIIEQFVILFHTLESEEDLFHLFKLNIIFKSFLGYDSFDIFSLLFEKSNIMDIIGILEYDHTFDERVNHRDYLKTKTNFKKFFMIDKSVKTSCSEWSFLNNDSVSSSSSLSFAGSEGPVVKFDNDRNEEIVPLNDPSSSNGSIEEFDSAEKTDERSDSAERAGTADKIESSLKTDFDEKIESSLKTDFDEKIESSETASPVNVLGVADRIPEQRKIEDRNSEETVFFEKDAHSEAIVEQETVDEKNSCNKENIKAKEYTDDKSDIVKNGSYEKETNDTKISKKERRNEEEEEEEKEKNSVIEEICGKAVLIYRVQYIIDNFMPAPNIFEDKSTCLLNYVNHHKANLCNVIYDNTELMQNIFIFLSDISDEYSKKEQISDAVYFLHEFCHLSRSLNPYDKEFFFGWLETYNLLPTMNFLLCECELGIKKKALDIITLIIDFKITTVREFVVKQINENLSDDNSTNDEYSRVSLLDEVIKIMVEYHDDPISLVCNDIINSLLDNENQASKKAEMQNFYNGFFSTSFCLLTKCFTDNVVDGIFINDDYKTSSLLAKILSLCSRWCLISAPTFIDSLILNGSIKYASCFFQSKHKFLVCESIKFFRKLIGLDNVEINEQIAKEEVIIKIADFFKNVAFVNNLLNNLILELFDHIVDEDLHMLFNPIVDKYRALYESINYIEVFQRMIAKREISSNRNSNFVSLSLNTTANSDRSKKEITPRKRSHETDEETWFESEDETKKSKDSSSPENDRDDEYTEKSINELFANKVKGKILIEEEEDALDKIVNSNFVQEGNSNFKPTITKNNKKKPEDGIFKFTFKKLISNPPPPPLPTDHISKSLPNNIHMNTVDNGFDPSHFEKLDEFNNDEMDDASKKKSDDSDETQDQLVNI